MKTNPQILYVTSFQELDSTPFVESVNALCWQRKLVGDFAEIVHSIKSISNITIIEKEHLTALALSEEGEKARAILLNDMNLLEQAGASPTLNLITHYERDETNAFFSTDVYSFHVDRSPVPTHTFLCTYYGEPSNILPNEQAEQKIRLPHIRRALQQEYGVSDEVLDAYAREHFFDLHYQAAQDSTIISVGRGNLWKLAVDYPNCPTHPCIHSAPLEKPGEPRLLLIC
jgi:hypothetical protein